MDVVISFPDHGFHLRFDPQCQVCPYLQSGYREFSHFLQFIPVLYFSINNSFFFQTDHLNYS